MTTLAECIKKMKDYKGKKDEKEMDKWFDSLTIDASQSPYEDDTIQGFYSALACMLKKMMKARKGIFTKSDFYKKCKNFIGLPNDNKVVDLDEVLKVYDNKEIKSEKSILNKIGNNLKDALKTVNTYLLQSLTKYGEKVKEINKCYESLNSARDEYKKKHSENGKREKAPEGGPAKLDNEMAGSMIKEIKDQLEKWDLPLALDGNVNWTELGKIEKENTLASGKGVATILDKFNRVCHCLCIPTVRAIEGVTSKNVDKMNKEIAEENKNADEVNKAMKPTFGTKKPENVPINKQKGEKLKKEKIQNKKIKNS